MTIIRFPKNRVRRKVDEYWTEMCDVIPLHDPTCDVDPMTMYWRESGASGKYYICRRCMDRINAESKSG